MVKSADCPKITGYQDGSGRWILQLPDPFGARWYPLDSLTLAELLDVSPRTARRICRDPSRLRAAEIGWLQVQIFGLIPDPAFLRLGMFFQGGRLYSRKMPDVDFCPGDLAAWVIQRQAFSGVVGDLAAARARIEELERLLNPPPVLPSNVIRFPGR